MTVWLPVFPQALQLFSFYHSWAVTSSVCQRQKVPRAPLSKGKGSLSPFLFPLSTVSASNTVIQRNRLLPAVCSVRFGVFCPPRRVIPTVTRPPSNLFSHSLSRYAGKQFWVFKDTVLQSGYPKDISQFAHGMPSQSIDTALWWEDVAKTYFFKGDRWVRVEVLDQFWTFFLESRVQI